MNSLVVLKRSASGVLFLLFLMALVPSVASGQTSLTTISGLVTDETGAVLPGVTVEASSPALIEKSRVAVTNGQGRYSVVDLRPGTYTVTFTLSGFRTFVREGLQVTAGASVPVSVKLSVGSIEETVTVTGLTPLVDVQQAARREVLNKDVLAALPTSRTTLSVGAIVPGIKMTGTMVGGQGSTVVQQYVRAPGQAAQANTVLVDGIDVELAGFGGGQQGYNNFGMVQEVALETNPASAEVTGAGVKINMIPRDGGNQFAGDMFFSGMTKAMQANNITPELRARGLRTPTGTEWIYDLNPAFGGPVLKNRLWFFTSGRINRAKLAPASATYFNFDSAGRPSRGEQAFNDTATDNASFRLTWQVNSKNKVANYFDRFWRYQSHFALDLNQDAATASRKYNRGKQYIWPTKWTSTWTNRLLSEVAFQYFGFYHLIFQNQDGVTKPRGTPEWFANASHQDIITGLIWRAPSANFMNQVSHQPSASLQGAVSYVTGSHTLRLGGSWTRAYIQYDFEENNAALVQQYRNGVPESVSVAAQPSSTGSNTNADVGLFVQDRWTMGRLTMNPGLRYEYFNNDIRATSSPAGRFVPARSIAQQPLFRLHDVLPRFSMVYDLFGEAKTAVKFSAGRYVQRMSLNTIRTDFVPISGVSEVRNWRDCDFIPRTSTCSSLVRPTNGDDIAQDNEIGPSAIDNFGFRAVNQPDENFKRESTWNYSVSVDQQVGPALGVTAAWYHQREGRIWTTYDRAETPAAFTRFTIANPCATTTSINCGVSAPSDPIPVFNLIPGTPTGNVFFTSSDKNKRVYNGFEASARARIPGGATVVGGWFADRKVSTLCDVTNLNLLRFCDQAGELHQDLGAVPSMPFQHEFKLSVSYPLPGAIQFGMSFISYPGGASSASPNVNWLDVDYPVPPAAFPGGRTRAVTVDLVAPGQKFLDRLTQLDLSVKRTFRLGSGMELLPSFEAFNLTNASTVLGENQTYGSALGQPSSTLPGRFMRLGAILKF